MEFNQGDVFLLTTGSSGFVEDEVLEVLPQGFIKSRVHGWIRKSTYNDLAYVKIGHVEYVGWPIKRRIVVKDQ